MSIIDGEITMGKIKNWSSAGDSISHSGLRHDRTSLAVRVEQFGESEFEFPSEPDDPDPNESDEDESYAKWVTFIAPEHESLDVVEVLSTTSTVSDARSEMIRYARENTNGDHNDVETNAMVEIESDDVSEDSVDPVEKALEARAEWHGTRECPLCGSSGQFSVASRPEVFAMYGPSEVASFFSNVDEATHACLDCGFLWFGVAAHVDATQSAYWNVRVADDGKRIERVDTELPDSAESESGGSLPSEPAVAVTATGFGDDSDEDGDKNDAT